MANSSGSMGAVHYWLIAFGMTTLILSFTTYMGFKDQTELKQAAIEADSKQKKADQALSNALTEIGALKDTIGHKMDKVGVDAANDPATVIGAMNDDMKKYGSSLAKSTYKDTIISIRQQLDSLTQERDQLKADVQDARSKMLALNNDYTNKVAAFQKNTTEAKTDLQGHIRQREDMVSTKDQEIAQSRTDLNEKRLELAQAEEQFDRFKQAKEKQLATLTDINDKLRKELDQLNQTSFDKPDGLIRSVDNSAGIITINLGYADNLLKQTTFSIYDKRNQGVGRGAADIKGKAEVTRILDQHLAECRVTDEDPRRPIAPGDIVFSPLWEPGAKLKFSFVGLIDLDGDGRSDRKLLHDIILAAGAEIDNEVDDQGIRSGDGISVDTKYLVVGEIPDPSNFPPGSADAERVSKISQQLKALDEEARYRGVRTVSLNDFLEFIGYEPKRRLFDPHDPSANYEIKAGSRN